MLTTELADLLPKDFADKLADDKYKVFRAYNDALVTRPSWKVRPPHLASFSFPPEELRSLTHRFPSCHPSEQDTFDEEYLMTHMKHMIEKRRAAAAAAEAK